MKIFIPLLFLGILMVGFACRQGQSDAELKEKGAAISKKLVATLMTELQTEMQKNGIPGAINYCSLKALPITDSISRAEQVEISRVSHRFRNPANAADKQEIEMIQNYIAQQRAGEELLPQVVTRNGKKVFYGPILLAAPLCLSCHGPVDRIDPEVQSALNEKYPEDQAVGFNLDEVRGMFKILFE